MSGREPSVVADPLAERIALDADWRRAAVSPDDDLAVLIHAVPGEADGAAGAVSAAGGTVDSNYGDVVHATVRADRIADLAAGAGVRRIEERSDPKAHSTSEGVGTTNADRLQNLGLTGTDVTVAVIDLEFDDGQSEIADQVIGTIGDSQHFDTAEAHGTACAEIVAEMAPGADLVLASALSYSFPNLMDEITGQYDPDVVTMSLGYEPTIRLDGRDYLSDRIVEYTSGSGPNTAEGGVFCVSAGNEANGSHWDGPWQDAGNGYMDFGGGDEFFRIEVNGTSEEVVVQSDADWSTEAGYVVELYDANENFVKSASRSTTPATSVSVPSPGTHYLKIGDEGLDGTEHFDLFPWIGVDFPVSTSARSLGIPATCPDSTTLTTAAVRHGTDELEAFSSRGPTQDGRRGVDVSAPDGTVSDTYDGEFYGTSAAAPHAAGAAALLAGFPAVDNEDVVEALTSTARDISDPEVPAPTNRRIGYGYVELGGGLDDLAGLLREGLWAPDNGRSQRASPAVDADRVYVGGLGSDVVAYRRGDGRAWTYTRDGALSDSSPVVVGDTVYVGGGGGRLHALGAADGRVRWTHATDSAVTSTPAVAEGQVYFGTNDGVVRAVAASDGTELWTTGVGGPVYSEVATASGLVFVTTTGGDLVCLDATTGVEQWRFATGTDLGAASPLVANGRVFVAADAVYAFDASAVRTRQWDASYGGTVGGSPAYGDGTVFVGDAHESLVALDDANGGTERWVRTIGGAFETRPTVAGDRVLAPSDTGYLYAFLTDGTEIGRTELPGESRSSPAVDGDDIYLGTRSGALVRH